MTESIMTEETETLDGGALAARTLADAGVEVIFALHGGHLDTFFTGCVRYGIKLVDCRHEAAAVNAADGYARTTGRMGVAAVTAGPGLFNSVAGISNAAADNVGVVVITSSPPLGEAETGEMQGGLDQMGVVAPITKWAHRATSAERIPDLVRLAVRHAGGNVPGPVVLDIPIDIAFTPVQSPIRSAPEPITAPARPVPSQETIREVVQLLDAAERPAVIVGDASLSLDIGPALEHFATRTGIPVWSTTLTRGMLPGSHPLNGGSLGSIAVLPMIGVEAPDLVILAGASQGLLLGGESFVRMIDGARVVQLHLDPAEIARLSPVEVGVIGDVGAALTSIADGCKPVDRSTWASQAVAAKTFASTMFEGVGMEPDGIHPFRASKEVADVLDSEAILIRDGGESAAWIDWAVSACDLSLNLGLGYQGHLGVGQGFAVGAQVAQPERQVVQVTGDGAIGFHIQEWDTMVRHNLPIITIILNNSCWGMSIHGQHAVYGPDGDVISRLNPTRYDLVAEGFGAFGQHVTEIEEIAPAIRRAKESGRPSVINIATSGEVVHPITTSMLGDLTATDEIVVPYYKNIPR